MDEPYLVQGIQEVLDALTFESFYNLSEKLLHLLINNNACQRVGVTGKLILNKAIDVPGASFLYARLVQIVFQHCQEPSDPGDIFLKEFWQLWKNEFVRVVLDGGNKTPEVEAALVNTKPRLEEARWKLRMKILGIARLIGESFKLQLVQLHVMKDCIDSSLGVKTEEGYEFLYDLLINCGEELERDLKFGCLLDRGDDSGFFEMDELFETLKELSFDTCGVSLRARVTISDLVDHRNNYWKAGGTQGNVCRSTVLPQYEGWGNLFGKTDLSYNPMMYPVSNCIPDNVSAAKPRNTMIRRYHREELLRIGRKMKGRKLSINLPISDILKAPKCIGYSSKLSTESISPRPIENYCSNKRSRDGIIKRNVSLSLNKIADTTGVKAKSDRVSMWLMLARTKRTENIPSYTPIFKNACL